MWQNSRTYTITKSVYQIINTVCITHASKLARVVTLPFKITQPVTQLSNV